MNIQIAGLYYLDQKLPFYSFSFPYTEDSKTCRAFFHKKINNYLKI